MKLQAPALCRTLIVEDDHDSCEALALLLRRWGHEVECVTTAGAALVRIDEWRPDCLLLDLMLPDAAGGVVLRKVRANKLNIRVAIMTAAGETSPILKGARIYSPDAIFHKPLHYKELRRWLDQASPPGDGNGGGGDQPFTAPS
jgi:two-component system phosphate regulon response regulator PhoB